jgi:hypothetical protein
MKRVNEVFELPVDEIDICEAVDHYSEEKDAAIVRAVNHVDALADALECIVMNAEDSAFESWLDKNHPSGDVSEVQYKFERSSEFKDFIDEFELARKALAAYRGEK